MRSLDSLQDCVERGVVAVYVLYDGKELVRNCTELNLDSISNACPLVRFQERLRPNYRLCIIRAITYLTGSTAGAVLADVCACMLLMR